MDRYPEMVWLDLDDTLFDHSYSVARGLECIQQQYPAFAGHQVDDLVRLYNIALNEVYPDFLSGAIDFQEMRRRKLIRFSELANVTSAAAPDTAAFHPLYDAAYNRERRAVPGSLNAVRKLQEQGIEVAVLTNGISRTQQEKLRAIGFEFLVPHLLPSEEAGFSKPDPRIFEWALHRTGKHAHQVVMIGDNPVNDIEGALGCGIRAIYYDPRFNERCFLTRYGAAPAFADWNQLPGILEQIDPTSDPRETVAR